MSLFRRRKPEEEFPLPADYRPVDYTSLPDEEPRGPSRKAQFLIALGSLALIGALGAAVYFFVFADDDAPTNRRPTTVAKNYDLTIRKADLERRNDQLSAVIQGQTTLEEGTVVTASLLEDGEPFELWDTEVATTTVDNKRINMRIPAAEDFPAATEDLTYTVQLLAEVGGQVVTATRELNVLSAAQALFLSGGGEPVAENPSPTPADVEPPTPTPEGTTQEPPPEPTPSTPGPFKTTASAQATLYLSPYNQTETRGTVGADEPLTVVSRHFSGDWYLVAAGTKSGWMKGTAIDLAGANVPVSGGLGNQAAVFNGGNIRRAPVSGDVVGQVRAGQTVKLLERTSESDWFKIEAPEGTGWVSASLLTIDPKVAAALQVAP